LGAAVSFQGSGGSRLGDQHVGLRHAHPVCGVGGHGSAARRGPRPRPARLLPAVRGALSADSTVSDGGGPPPGRPDARPPPGAAGEPRRRDRVHRAGVRAVRLGGGPPAGRGMAARRPPRHVARGARGLVRAARGAVEALTVLGAGLAVAFLPARWTGARSTEGIAGAAAMGLVGTVVFSAIDIVLLRPFKAYPWTWDAIGGGSTWWYLPIWWMLG